MRPSVLVRIGPFGPRCSPARPYCVFFLPLGGASGPKLCSRRGAPGADGGPPKPPSRGPPLKGRGAPPPPPYEGRGPDGGPPNERGPPPPAGRLSRGCASFTASGRPRNVWLFRRL